MNCKYAYQSQEGETVFHRRQRGRMSGRIGMEIFPFLDKRVENSEKARAVVGYFAVISFQYYPLQRHKRGNKNTCVERALNLQE